MLDHREHILGECVRGLVSAGGVVLERLQEHHIQIGVHSLIDRTWAFRGLLQNASDHTLDRAAHIVRQLPCQQLIQQHAQRVDVRAGINGVRISLELLGRCVGQRAHKLAGHCSHHGHRFFEVILGEPEIQHPWLTRLIDDDVARLEVSVQHAPLVGGLYCVSNLQEQSQSLLGGDVVIGDITVECWAVDEFHDQIAAIVRRLAAVDNGHDAGVVDA